MLNDQQLKARVYTKKGKLRKAFASLWERYQSAKRMVSLPDPNRAEAWQIIAVHRKRQLLAVIRMHDEQE